MQAEQTTITQKGQVTVPVQMRRALGLKAKDKVIFELDEEAGVLRMRPATSGIRKWFGFAGKLETPMTDKELHDAFEQAVADEVMEEDR